MAIWLSGYLAIWEAIWVPSSKLLSYLAIWLFIREESCSYLSGRKQNANHTPTPLSLITTSHNYPVAYAYLI